MLGRGDDRPVRRTRGRVVAERGQAARVRSLLDGTTTWLTSRQIAHLADCPYANVNPYLSEYRRYLDSTLAARRLIRRWDKPSQAWVFRLEATPMPLPIVPALSRRLTALAHPGLVCSARCGMRASILTRAEGEPCRRIGCKGLLLAGVATSPTDVVTMTSVEEPT